MAVIRDPAKVSARRGTVYPAQFAQGFEGRVKRALGDADELTQFGINLTTIEPGAMSAQRHWHRTEDEFIYMLDGDLTLVTDAGEETLPANPRKTRVSRLTARAVHSAHRPSHG